MYEKNTIARNLSGNQCHAYSAGYRLGFMYNLNTNQPENTLQTHNFEHVSRHTYVGYFRLVLSACLWRKTGQKSTEKHFNVHSNYNISGYFQLAVEFAAKRLQDKALL